MDRRTTEDFTAHIKASMCNVILLGTINNNNQAFFLLGGIGYID